MALVTIRVRRGTAAEWTAANPVLALGEPGLERDTAKTKFGDGTSTWNSLPYSSAGSGGGGAVSSVAGRTGAVVLTKTDVGLASVDNTADAAKTVLASNKLATARAINGVSFDGTAAITVADATKVPTTRQVNGHPLSADIVVSAADVLAQPLNIGSGGTATAGVVVVANGATTPTGLPNGTVIVELS